MPVGADHRRLAELDQAARGQLGDDGRERQTATPRDLLSATVNGRRKIDGGTHADIIGASALMQVGVGAEDENHAARPGLQPS